MMSEARTIQTGVIAGTAIFRSAVTIAGVIFATDATGASNFKQTTRYEFAIVATPFIAAGVTKWINATIAERSCAGRVLPC